MSSTMDQQAPAVTDDQSLGLTLPKSKDGAQKLITNIYLSQLDPDDIAEPTKISNDLIHMFEHEFVHYNKNAEPGTKWRIPQSLPPEVIARVMLHVYKIKNINCAGVNSERDYDILGIYQEWGENKGIYISDEAEIRHIIREYNNTISLNDIKSIMLTLQDEAERVERCSDPDLIAVNNGIFNYKTKILEPFSPDIVFTAKSHVDYNPVAANVVIHNDEDNTDWDIESWIKDLFDDPEIPETIWQILGAIIRPNVRWSKSAWFVSEKGNNGKGTLCQLMRNITGPGTYASIPLSDFGKDFMLEPLIGATAIITDENDVGTYIDRAADIKAIITNDVIRINRKFKKPIAYQFKGFMVQCINEMPRVKDKSESFYRRQLFIPFAKCYTGIERKYIKEDYLNRQDVLEYALYRILNMDYYTLKEPDSCKQALEGYKTFNDPIRDFKQDILKNATWRCLPTTLLYEMYKGWSKINNPNGSIQGRNTFLNDLKNQIDPAKDGWYYVDTDSEKRVLDRMNGQELLLDEYNCTSWMQNPNSTNLVYRTTPKIIPAMAGGLFKID